LKRDKTPNNKTVQITPPLQQGSCPAVSSIPAVSACAGQASDCWSVGQPDVDCVGDALCCFDGCANRCQGPGGSRSPAPPPNPRPQQSQPQPVRQPVQQQPRQPSRQKPKPRPKVNPKPAKDPWPQQPRQPVKNDPWPQQQQSSQPRPVVKQPVQNNFQQSASRPIIPAATKPFIQCPSAMKCVPKINCDFEGVMRNEVFNLSPDLEMLRVPLIPCVNRQAGNVVDVCCRDPNYKDPWPDMQGGGGNMGINMRKQNNGNKNNRKKNNKNGNSYG